MGIVTKMTQDKGFTKSEIIAEFIRVNEPTRLELTRFIVVTLNKATTSENFEKNRAMWRGYYAFNLSKWKSNGKIYVDKKTKTYRLTKEYVRDGRMYSSTPEKTIERLESKIIRDTKSQISIINDLKEIANNWRILANQRKALIEVKDINISNHKNALRLAKERANKFENAVTDMKELLENIG